MKCAATTIVDGNVRTCSYAEGVDHELHHSCDLGGLKCCDWKTSAEFNEGIGDDGYYTAHVTKPITSKARWDLIPWEQLQAVERVLTHGLSKHGSEFGWKERTRAEHVQALLRHAIEYARGKRFDEDTKQPVLAHVVARALFVMFHDGEVLK